MPDKRNRERVVAEISLGHVIEIAREIGRPLTQEEALHFLNHDGHAYAMWTRMMQAGEKYLKSTLRRPAAVGMARPVERRRMTM